MLVPGLGWAAGSAGQPSQRSDSTDVHHTHREKSRSECEALSRGTGNQGAQDVGASQSPRGLGCCWRCPLGGSFALPSGSHPVWPPHSWTHTYHQSLFLKRFYFMSHSCKRKASSTWLTYIEGKSRKKYNVTKQSSEDLAGALAEGAGAGARF